MVSDALAEAAASPHPGVRGSSCRATELGTSASCPENVCGHSPAWPSPLSALDAGSWSRLVCLRPKAWPFVALLPTHGAAFLDRDAVTDVSGGKDLFRRMEPLFCLGRALD